MSTQTLGILIGGILAAVFYALSGVATKAGVQAGAGVGPFVLFTGLAIVAVGIACSVAMPESVWNGRGLAYGLVNGLLWGAGTACVTIALGGVFQVPLSKLVPLYNMNTLIAVLLSLWLFAEWQQVRSMQLLLGAMLIVAGGILVSTASRG